METYIQILIATIVGGLSGALISYLTKIYLSEKIKASIKAEYDDKLETLKSELTKNETAISSALNSQTQGLQIGQKETIDSLKIYWEEYLKVRYLLLPIAQLDFYLWETELNKIFTDEWQGNDSVPNELKNINYSVQKDITNSSDIVERLRPFINTNLWIVFSFHKIFTSRILFLSRRSVIKKKFEHWKSDTSLLRLAKENLSDTEFNYIQKQSSGTIKAIQEFIEQKMLLEITNILTGNNAAENTYNQALRLIELNKTDVK